MSKQTSRFDRNGAAKQQRKNLGRVNEPHFMKGELALILIDVLRHLNGSASKKAIEREIERRLQSGFNPADLETVGEGIPRWKKNVQWARFDLVERGIMKENSQRGIWELSESSYLEIS